MRAYGYCIRKLLNSASCHGANSSGGFVRAYTVTNHSSSELYKETLPCEWYENKLSSLNKLSCALKDIDFVDGRLENINNADFIVKDDRIKQKMHAFKSLARIFIGSPMIQQKLKEKCLKFPFFENQSEREPLVVDTLSKVSNFLNISAQQRKLVRCTICPQVTQYRIWVGALEEIMNGLKEEVDWLDDCRQSKETKLGQQVILSCLKSLSESAVSYEAENSTPWMRPVPVKTAKASASKWEDVLEMVTDLITYLEHEKSTLYYLGKLASMKEGLFQIRDAFLDKSIGYREIRGQEIHVQKKLTKTLGHSSQCLFNLLLFYLHGRVQGIEVDLCGGLYEKTSAQSMKKKEFSLSMGRILTSAEEKMLQRGVKQLDRALGIFEFVWETAGIKEPLELQGHIWCVGAEERSITYRGKTFFVHDLGL